MPRRIYVFDPPDRFVTGTVGPPGKRTFYLQARKGRAVVSVALEKVQVALLADRLSALLDEVERHGVDVAKPEAGGGSGVDAEPLDEPILESFRVGTLALAWDGEAQSVLVEARAETETDAEESEDVPDDDESGPDLVRVRLSPPDARRFVGRAVGVLAGGRPPCPLCGLPLDPQGHLCPRRNGYVN